MCQNYYFFSTGVTELSYFGPRCRVGEFEATGSCVGFREHQAHNAIYRDSIAF